MELQDNSPSRLDDSGRRKFVVVVAIILLVSGIITLIVYALTSRTQEEPAPTDTLYNDPYSGEVISDPPGKASETFGTDPNAPTFFGQSKLLDVGISHFQVRGMQDGVYEYFTSQNQQVREISVVVDTINIVPRSRFSDSTKNTVQFDIVADRKTTYKVTMDYFDIRSIQLYIADDTGKQLFDSGVLTE